MNMQKRETLLQAARIGLVIILVLSMFAASPAAPVKAANPIIVVGPTGDYANIASAVYNAPPNSVILVQPGSYIDAVDLRRMGESTPEGAIQGNLTIIAEDTGNPEDTVVWAGGGIKISSGNVPFAGSLWIDGIQMSSSNNSVISLVDAHGLILTDVTIASSGNPTLGATVDAISLKWSSGFRTVALYNTTVNNFVRDGLDVQVSGSANVNVLVESSVFKASDSAYKPQKAVDVYAAGTSTTHLTVRTSEMIGMYSSAISAVADGATPVTLGTHIYDNIKILNVAQDSGTNAIEVRAKGTGAHEVETWFKNNTITMPNHSDGIEIEAAAPGTFSTLMVDTRIDTVGGTGSPLGRGIVIDNGTGGTAAHTGKFRLESNTVKNVLGSAIDLHLNTTNTANWSSLLTNNYLAGVNSGNPAALEGLHFYVKGAASKPTFTMLFTGNNMMTNTPANTIKLENSGATFRIVSQLSSATAEVNNVNFNFVPYVYGTVNVVRSINAPITVNEKMPLAVEDYMLTWMNNPRTHEVLANDTDDGAVQMSYVHPLGVSGGIFTVADSETPDNRFDDMVVYQPPSGYLGEDVTYYVVQDDLGCASIGRIDALVVAAPLFVPVISK